MHETSNPDALQQLAKLGERFSGVSLDFRRHAAGTGWPAPWRARPFASVSVPRSSATSTPTSASVGQLDATAARPALAGEPGANA